jgi:hypothetical protein
MLFIDESAKKLMTNLENGVHMGPTYDPQGVPPAKKRAQGTGTPLISVPALMNVILGHSCIYYQVLLDLSSTDNLVLQRTFTFDLDLDLT